MREQTNPRLSKIKMVDGVAMIKFNDGFIKLKTFSNVLRGVFFLAETVIFVGVLYFGIAFVEKSYLEFYTIGALFLSIFISHTVDSQIKSRYRVPSFAEEKLLTGAQRFAQ